MQNGRQHILFFCMLAMMAGLFFSRALLSIGMICFVVFSFFHHEPKEQLRNFSRTPLLWGMSLLFFFPLLSGLWSEDNQQWLEMIQVKAPLFFLPLAFAAPIGFSKQQWNGLACFFILLVSAGALWSIIRYGGDAAQVNEGYLRAKSMLSPLENDHVRFSWLVYAAILLSGWMYHEAVKQKKNISWLWLLLGSGLIIYLHLLVARTGLFSFYISVLMLALWIIIKKVRRIYGVLILLILAALPLIAYYTIPTFQNRAKYFNYEIAYARNASYLPGANDAMRVVSLKAGWRLMKDDPLTGVGFGDIRSAVNKWYEENYPGMQEADKIYPSSEWMMYGAGNGIPGFILFSISMCIPFFTRIKNKLVWLMLNTTAAFSFIADIGLEVQFGVFIYSFCVLWCWKWLNAEKI